MSIVTSASAGGSDSTSVELSAVPGPAAPSRASTQQQQGQDQHEVKLHITQDELQQFNAASPPYHLHSSPAGSPDGAASTNGTGAGVEDDDHIVCRVKKYEWKPPPGHENHAYRPHQGEGSQYLRDFILGVNDGLISTFLVVVGVAAGGASVLTCLLTAISTGVAGAISMGLGEYIATKSQYTVNQSEFKLEEEHFIYHRDMELRQLRGFLTEVGLEGNLLEAVVAQVGSNDKHLMKMMQAFEFGAGSEELERNPLLAMWTSGKLFALGSLPTILPFFWSVSSMQGLWTAAIFVGVALFLVGIYKSRTTGGSWFWEGFENFIFGAIGAGISFAVGVIFQKASGNASITF